MGSDGGSPLSFGEVAELSSKEVGLAEAIACDCVGPSRAGSPVFAGAAGSLGKDTGLAASVEGVAPSGTVVDPAGVDAGASVGRGVGRSPVIGVNAVGGSKRARVLKPNWSLNIPVQLAAHIGLRVNISIGGIISGSHGGPIVVITVPLAAVLLPKPQVGQARSLTLSGAIPST